MEALPAGGPAVAVSELKVSSDRLELLAWLQRNAPSLAELYEGAVLMLQNRPGNVLAKEPPDAKEFTALVRSGLARLKDAENEANSLDSRFDLAYKRAAG